MAEVKTNKPNNRNYNYKGILSKKIIKKIRLNKESDEGAEGAGFSGKQQKQNQSGIPGYGYLRGRSFANFCNLCHSGF